METGTNELQMENVGDLMERNDQRLGTLPLDPPLVPLQQCLSSE